MHLFKRHQVFLNLQWKQVMRNFSGINFNCTCKLHLDLLIRIYFGKNLIYPEVQAAEILVKLKSSWQVLNILNMFSAKYHIKWSSRYTNSSYLLFYDWLKIIGKVNKFWGKWIWSYKTTKVSQRDSKGSHEAEFVFCLREKDWYIDIKRDKEPVMLFFAENLSIFFRL